MSLTPQAVPSLPGQLADCSICLLYTSVVDGVIAPGTSGSFDILLDGTGSEVGIDYIVTLAEKTADNPKLPADLTIKAVSYTHLDVYKRQL